MFTEAHDSAVQTYGDGDQAYREAYAALKHKFEKRGDHWIAKELSGPEDYGLTGAAILCTVRPQATGYNSGIPGLCGAVPRCAKQQQQQQQPASPPGAPAAVPATSRLTSAGRRASRRSR
jgi:hypothetical protein